MSRTVRLVYSTYFRITYPNHSKTLYIRIYPTNLLNKKSLNLKGEGFLGDRENLSKNQLYSRIQRVGVHLVGLKLHYFNETLKMSSGLIPIIF